MNDRKLDNATTNSQNQANWATDEEWVRAAANLEAETGVDFIIRTDLGNSLNVSDQIISDLIDVERLKVVSVIRKQSYNRSSLYDYEQNLLVKLYYILVRLWIQKVG